MKLTSRLKKLLSIKTITRLTLNKKLINELVKIKNLGHVLDIGSIDSPYRNYINCSTYEILDIGKKSNHVDYLEDIHKTTLNDETFDGIMLTEVLEHLYDPKKAIDQVYRICRKEGVIIASTRFIYQYHGTPFDYYRYTEFGLMHLFKKFKEVQIITHGNKFMTIWELLTSYKYLRALRIFNRIIALFDSKKSTNPLGFIIIAKKTHREQA